MNGLSLTAPLENFNRKRKIKEMARPTFATRDITEPLQGYTVYTRHWWVCKDGNPAKALFYGDSPQCNVNKRVLEANINYVEQNFAANVSIVFVPVAYLRQRDN